MPVIKMISQICPVGSPAGKETLKSQDDSALDSLKKEDHLKSFDEMPHPKGLPIIGTLWDFMKKDGLKFNKMFEVTYNNYLFFLGLL